MSETSIGIGRVLRVVPGDIVTGLDAPARVIAATNTVLTVRSLKRWRWWEFIYHRYERARWAMDRFASRRHVS